MKNPARTKEGGQPDQNSLPNSGREQCEQWREQSPKGCFGQKQLASNPKTVFSAIVEQ